MRTLLGTLFLWGAIAMNTIPDFQNANYVIVGEVRAVGPEPRAWSGRIAQYQEVEYTVRTVLKGEDLPAKFVVAHAVVKGSPTAREDRPGLSPHFFAKGRVLIVGAIRKNRRLIANVTLPWSERIEEEARKSIVPGA